MTTETVFRPTQALWLGDGNEHCALELDMTGLNVKGNLYLLPYPLVAHPDLPFFMADITVFFPILYSPFYTLFPLTCCLSWHTSISIVTGFWRHESFWRHKTCVLCFQSIQLLIQRTVLKWFSSISVHGTNLVCIMIQSTILLQTTISGAMDSPFVLLFLYMYYMLPLYTKWI